MPVLVALALLVLLVLALSALPEEEEAEESVPVAEVGVAVGTTNTLFTADWTDATVVPFVALTIPIAIPAMPPHARTAKNTMYSVLQCRFAMWDVRLTRHDADDGV